MIRLIIVLLIAGMLEVTGNYFIWLWIRNGQPAWFAFLGAAALFAYSVIPALQPFQYGRVYALYGGLFILLSVSAGWIVEKRPPTHFETFGVMLLLMGALVLLLAPAKSMDAP